ncbi:hypothetical protein CCH79_00017275 [Gambusia affinis]|uniref:Uncharacterized protein n=1 Tax=Gambusia affinis TaxID=33528 RepID=A0A315WDL3_GAMAF|nr:hypothetical protein CCH79_00017275 [Gambusia affinis]
MLLPRTSVRSALLILLLLFILLQTPGRCHAAARHRGSGPRAEARGGLHSLAQLAGRYRSGPCLKSDLEVKTKSSVCFSEGHLSDPKHKEKFITHMTGVAAASCSLCLLWFKVSVAARVQSSEFRGFRSSLSDGSLSVPSGPLYFKPQCRKQFHRLYNHTRDCTVPACLMAAGGRAAPRHTRRPGGPARRATIQPDHKTTEEEHLLHNGDFPVDRKWSPYAMLVPSDDQQLMFCSQEKLDVKVQTVHIQQQRTDEPVQMNSFSSPVSLGPTDSLNLPP